MLPSHFNLRTLSFIAVLGTIDSDIQGMTITEEESANFTCNFFRGNQSIVYWTVDDKEQSNCFATEEEIRPDSNGCYTTETRSVLLIRNTSSFTPDRRHQVQCILQQNIPPEFRDDNSFNEEYDTLLTRESFLLIESISELILSTISCSVRQLDVRGRKNEKKLTYVRDQTWDL